MAATPRIGFLSSSYLYVFQVRPDTELPAALKQPICYYHDRPLYQAVAQALGAEPALDPETRSAMFDAVEAQIEGLDLEKRLYSDDWVAAKGKMVDMRGFVVGTTFEAVSAIAAREGWVSARSGGIASGSPSRTTLVATTR